MLYTLLVILFIVVCLFLILVVLLQQGKGADVAAAFGGASSQTSFGPRGTTTLLHKLTTGVVRGVRGAVHRALGHDGAQEPFGDLGLKGSPAVAAPATPVPSPAPAAPAEQPASPGPGTGEVR